MAQLTTGKDRRRGRFWRFSLRTLMAAVLLYAGLWTVTALWGCGTIEDGIRARSVNEFVCGFLRDLPKRPGFGPMGIHTVQPLKRVAKVTSHAYAPFLLRVEYEYTGVFNGKGKGWVFWLFGRTRWLLGDRDESDGFYQAIPETLDVEVWVIAELP